MITKTNLDAKLSQLEEKMERKMDFKVSQAVQKREVEITKLKNDLKELEEKKVDGKLVDEFESLRKRIEDLEKIIAEKFNVEISGEKIENLAENEEPDIITPDEI
jgi:predicted transcriptional regulator